MPFTFSHPALVLPLALLPRRWFSVTGLVIGSMVPDFEYFLRMRVQSEYSHTIAGLFWFDLSLAVLLALVFHTLVRNPLIENLPAALQSRLSRYKTFDFLAYFRGNWFVMAVSALVGAASHLLWDGFTYAGSFFAEVVPALSATVQVAGLQMPLYKVLRHISTMAGAAVILGCLWQLPRHKDSYEMSLRYWGTVAAIVLAVVGTRLVTDLDYRLYGHVVVTAIAALLLALVVTPLLLKATKA